MAVAASPDGRQLVMDLQGSIWLLPVERRHGAPDHRRVQRRAPARLVPRRSHHRVPWGSATAATTSGRWIRRAPTCGASRRGLTTIVSPPTRATVRAIAFSSDRGTGTNYDIWMLDLRTGAVTQVTRDVGRRLHAHLVARRHGDRLHRDARARGARARREHRERRRADARHRRAGAPMRRRGDRRARWSTTRARREQQPARARRCRRSPVRRMPSPSAPAGSRRREIVYTADGKIRRRAISGGARGRSSSRRRSTSRGPRTRSARATWTRVRRGVRSASSRPPSRPTGSRSRSSRSATCT